MLVGDVPARGEEFDGGFPLLLAKPHIANKVVQIPGQRLHYLSDSRVRGVVERCDDADLEVILDRRYLSRRAAPCCTEPLGRARRLLDATSKPLFNSSAPLGG